MVFLKKNFVYGLHLAMAAALVCLLGSCVSLKDREMFSAEAKTLKRIDTVTVKFTSYQPLHFIKLKDSIKTKAYNKLLEEARKKYRGEIDIRNISIKGSFSAWNLLTGLGAVGAGGGVGYAAYSALHAEDKGVEWIGYEIISPVSAAVFEFLVGNFQTITATGEVVAAGKYETTTAAAANVPVQKGVEGSLERAAEAVMDKLTPRSRIAIVYVSAQDRDVTEFIANELEFIMVNQGFTLIDRSQLDQIRKEQGFQMSDEVDDKTAVSIGKISGADVIITGAVTGSGDLRRLRLRALNTQTAQVMATASEKY